MSGTIIFIAAIIVIYYLGRYALTEGRRIEDQKKFMKNLDNYGKKKK